MNWKEAKEQFKYCSETGELLWFCRKPGIRPGMKAGYLFKGNKYVTVNGARVMAKNIVWLLRTGALPKSPLYHVDGDRTNTRFENLTTRKVKPSRAGQGINIQKGRDGLTLSAEGKTLATGANPEEVLAAVRALLVY